MYVSKDIHNVHAVALAGLWNLHACMISPVKKLGSFSATVVRSGLVEAKDERKQMECMHGCISSAIAMLYFEQKQKRMGHALHCTACDATQSKAKPSSSFEAAGRLVIIASSEAVGPAWCLMLSCFIPFHHLTAATVPRTHSHLQVGLEFPVK